MSIIPRKRRKAILVAFSLLLYWSLSFLSWSPSFPRLTSPPKLFIAANLYNNEAIIDHWTAQVFQLARWAGPGRAFISIYENGSTDGTKAALLQFKEQLTQANIPHEIIVDPTPKSFSVRRIPQLAQRRNQALIPLYKQSVIYDKILFLNDIWFTWKDAVELIQSKVNSDNDNIAMTSNEANSESDDYDAVCAMDYFGQFYDEFATREIDGGWLGSGNYPYFQDPVSRDLLRRELMVPVYSCWGGMIVFKAAPFLMVNSTTGDPLLSFRAMWPNDPQPALEASECCLIHTDLRRLDFTRIFINPKVKVAYDRFHYYYAHYIYPLRHIVLSWTNIPKARSEQEEVLWTKKLASINPMDDDDITCLWRPGRYD